LKFTQARLLKNLFLEQVLKWLRRIRVRLRHIVGAIDFQKSGGGLNDLGSSITNSISLVRKLWRQVNNEWAKRWLSLANS